MAKKRARKALPESFRQKSTKSGGGKVIKGNKKGGTKKGVTGHKVGVGAIPKIFYSGKKKK